jgi:hypothetical protein
MPPTDILRARFSNQHLARPEFEQPVQAVAWLGAVQAQDYAAAKWALGMRLKGATDAALDEAFNRGDILRTHVMRPTWHFVAPADLRWLLALTAPRVKPLLAGYDRALAIDEAVLKRARAALEKAMQGGRQLTRVELEAALRAAGIRQSGQDLGHIGMHAELDGLICSGSRRGKQFTYMLLEERVPPAPALSRDDALHALALRYFTSHGPAQVQDFAWWSGLTTADTRKGLALAGAALASETIDGREFWYAPGRPAAPMPPRPYLLPNYDEYTVAYRDRRHFYDAAAFTSPIARDNVPFANMIVIKGWVEGIWKRTLSAKTVSVETKPLRELTPAEQRGLEAAIEHYAEFLGLEVRKDLSTKDTKTSKG